MNMERSIPNNDPQQLPSSPKKKLHTKDKGTLADTITNARASLKNGKDISARNLMECSLRKPLTREPSFEFDPNLAKEDSESSAEEIVALDEEHTDFLSTDGGEGFNDAGYDDDDSIVEEIVEEYYEEEVVADDDDDEDYTDNTDGSLESLPPPIVIPKSLRVKDSDEEDDDDDSDDGSEDEDDSLPSMDVPQGKQQQSSKIVPTATTTNNQPKISIQPKQETKTLKKDVPVDMKKENLSTSTTSPKVATIPTKAATNDDSSNQEGPKQTVVKGASNIDFDNEIDRKATADTRGSEDITMHHTDANRGPVWEKPDWTKNNRLKATGISPARNLAKPITQLPALVSKKEMNEIKTPKKSNTMQAKLSLDNTKGESMMKYPKSPVPAAKVSVASMNAPKSAPQPDGGRKKFPVPTLPTSKDDSGNDDDFSSKIAWEKPEWAKKKVLRTTSKTETILSGGKLERPIGGIRPIE